ncbi:glycosyltransferase family 39 protein [Afifella sp. IM 167]|uniref:ArnT family glycosyltransferase n=1 Tax=Afifella sp. IM 167 TaxID=2033586 RepID=UPI001CCFE90C|nr:glycosyltransferase family 39 protein [Afifella sp. IM 167]MBZ8132439.1 glycosyl transferase family 39 [Afifella sp. IM 167]
MAAGSKDGQKSPMIGAPARFSPLAGLVVVLVAIVLFAPGIGVLPPIDRDEARFVQATKQMHESGDYIDIRFQDEPRHKKPVGIYWLQAVATAPFGGADAPIWAYRIPSFIGAVLAALATWFAGLALFGPRAAFAGALLMSSTILLTVEARLAKTDAVLAALTIFAIAVLARAWMEGRETSGAGRNLAPPPATPLALPLTLGFWAALGLGILVKGPIILMVVGLTLLLLLIASRSPAVLLRLRPLSGLALMLLIAVPWFIAIGIRSDWTFFTAAIGQDMLGKVASAQEAHGAPPGTYVALFFATAWPLAPFTLLAAPFIVGVWKRPAVFFALAWLVPSWLVFEAVPTKLPHYVLPLYPALALMSAAALEEGMLLAGKAWRYLAGFLLASVPIVIAIGAIALPLWLEKRLPAGTDLAGIGAAVLGVIGARAIARGREESALLAATVAAALIYLAAFQFGFPTLSAIRVSEHAAAAAHEDAVCDDPQIASAGYSEPSLVFFAGTDTRLTDGKGAADFLSGEGCQVALVEARQESAFQDAAANENLALSAGREVSGFNYSRGKAVTLRVYRRSAEAER